jgi:predicted MFS family arabinose efflux permease
MQGISNKEFQVDNIGTAISVVIASGIALLALFLGPVLVGAYIDKLGVSESRAGLILSSELTGFTLGSALLFFIDKINWRKILIVALVLMIFGNVLLTINNDLSLFVISRTVAGFGSGIVMTLTIHVISMMRNPDRVYGLWTIGQLSLGALGMLLFPWVIENHGINSVFVIWAVLAGLLFAAVHYFPTGRKNNDTHHSLKISRRFVLGVICLLGLFIYYGGQTGVWAYAERLGLSWGIERDVVNNTLFISLLAGIAGAAVAVFLGDRAGRAIPLSCSMIISAIAILMFMALHGDTVYLYTVCLFNVGWYLFLPYLSSIIAANDEDGRLLTGLAVIFPASLAAGPAIAALLIGEGESLLPCLIYGFVSVPLGLVFILPAATNRAGTTTQEST